MNLARNLKIESVSRLDPTPLLQVLPTQPVLDAIALMRQHSVGCVLVSLPRTLVGIFTERDLVRKVLAAGKPLSTPLSECMTADPVSVHPKDSIGIAIRRMEGGGYRHLPVVVDGNPVGILSVRRIIHYIVEHFPATVYNLPPDPGAVQTKREGA